LASMATPSAMAFSSSTCHSVFPSGSNVGRSGVTRARGHLVDAVDASLCRGALGWLLTSARWRSAVAIATDCRSEARRFSAIIPLGVTRANVRPASCPEEAALGVVDPFERAPNSRPPPLEGFASLPRVRPISADVANSTRNTPAMTVSRPIEARRLKDAECEEHFFFMDRTSDPPMILVLIGNVYLINPENGLRAGRLPR
jgi:hypothetical protein